MVEYGDRRNDQRIAQVAAERHPEAYAAELPESWAGHDVDMVLADRVLADRVLSAGDRAPRSPRMR